MLREFHRISIISGWNLQYGHGPKEPTVVELKRLFSIQTERFGEVVGGVNPAKFPYMNPKFCCLNPHTIYPNSTGPFRPCPLRRNDGVGWLSLPSAGDFRTCWTVKVGAGAWIMWFPMDNVPWHCESTSWSFHEFPMFLEVLISSNSDEYWLNIGGRHWENMADLVDEVGGFPQKKENLPMGPQLDHYGHCILGFPVLLLTVAEYPWLCTV